MRIDGLGDLLRRWGSVEAPRGKFDHGNDLFPRYVEPLSDFLDGGSGLEILKDSGNWQTRTFEDPRTADFAGNAFDSGAQ